VNEYHYATLRHLTVQYLRRVAERLLLEDDDDLTDVIVEIDAPSDESLVLGDTKVVVRYYGSDDVQGVEDTNVSDLCYKLADIIAPRW